MASRGKLTQIFGGGLSACLLIYKGWTDRGDVEDAILLVAVLILVLLTVVGSFILDQLAENAAVKRPTTSSKSNSTDGKSHD